MFILRVLGINKAEGDKAKKLDGQTVRKLESNKAKK